MYTLTLASSKGAVCRQTRNRLWQTQEAAGLLARSSQRQLTEAAAARKPATNL